MSLCERVAEDLRGEIARIVVQTRKRNREHGFMVCDVNGQLRAGALCSGSKCRVRIRDCGAGKMVGAVHSHPATDLSDRFSSEDFANAFQSRSKFICLVHGDKLRCTHLPRTAEETKGFRSAWTQADIEQRQYASTIRLYNRWMRDADADERTRLFKEAIGKEGEHIATARKLLRLVEIEPCEIRLPRPNP